MSPAPGRGEDPPPMPDESGRSGSPVPSSSPTRGMPCPRGMFGSEPQGSRRARPGMVRSPEPPPLTEVATGVLGQTWRAGGRYKAGGQRRHRFHKTDACVEHRFREPSRGKRMKVETLEWRIKALLPCFRISLYFWFPDFTLFLDLTV